MIRLGKVLWILFVAVSLGVVGLFVWQQFDSEEKVYDDNELYFRQKRDYERKLVQQSEFEFYYRSTRFNVVDNEVYLWNYSNREVNKYSLDGELLTTYGQFGNGPQDLERVVQIMVSEQHVTLFDAGNSAVKEFDKASGEFISSSKIEYPVDKGVYINDDQIFMQSYGEAGALSFGIYDETTRLVNSNLAVNKLFEKIPDSGLIYDGFFAPTQCGIFYVAYQMPEIYKLDESGSVDYNVKTIYNVPAPTILKSANITAPQNTFIHLLGLYADCDKIYILTSVVNKESQRVVDIYSSKDGVYLESVVVPTLSDGQNPTEIIIEDDLWYILYDEKVLTYTID